MYSKMYRGLQWQFQEGEGVVGNILKIIESVDG